MDFWQYKVELKLKTNKGTVFMKNLMIVNRYISIFKIWHKHSNVPSPTKTVGS